MDAHTTLGGWHLRWHLRDCQYNLFSLNYPCCGSTQGVRGWTWGHLDGVDRSRACRRPNLKVQWGLAVPVAGRNSPLRQSGNHAQMGLISAKVHLREMTFTNFNERWGNLSPFSCSVKVTAFRAGLPVSTSCARPDWADFRVPGKEVAAARGPRPVQVRSPQNRNFGNLLVVDDPK